MRQTAYLPLIVIGRRIRTARRSLHNDSSRRNGARSRIRNRCEITGRPHGFYRKLRISRIALRKLASEGKIPGMFKASW